MSNRFLCVFDLDGTLYPKESRITIEIRRRVINLIASTHSVSSDTAEKLYKELPGKYPNPYYGLRSINIPEVQYQEIFNSIDVESYIIRDTRLFNYFKQLSENADIIFVSFAPSAYVKRMLNVFGINSFVKSVINVSHETSYSKESIFISLGNCQKYEALFAVGDDKINDVIPAQKAGFISFLVNFNEDGSDIYSILAKLSGMLSERHVPRIMRVENIAICNEKCIICPYEKMKRRKGVMPDALFEKIIIEHSSSVDNPKLIFPASIGEPFLDHRFFDRVTFARQFYSEIATFTNATMLSKEVFLKYVQCGGTELMLTLHGFTEKMHSFITRTAFYHTVRSNIEKIAETNNCLGTPITLFLDIYADNSDECMKYIAQMTDLGIKAHRVDLEKTHNWGGIIKQYSRKATHDKCPRIYEQFGVLYNGTVVPCCIDYEGVYVLGNAYNKSLKDIFSSIKYKQLTLLEARGLIRNNTLCSFCNI